MTDYTAHIKEMLKPMFYSPIFTDQDYDEMIAEWFNRTGLSYAKISEQIEDGIKKGYTLETQKEVVKALILRH